MTSSLVGSEMCIRDRSWSTSTWWTQGRGQVPWQAGRFLRPMGDGAIAVSYTHLTLPTICSV
eukprot:7386735-Prorocentrum_lima.AAC.1